MRNKTKYQIILAIFIISLIASAILAFVPTSQVCGPETSGCSIVQNSVYEKTLGVNNAYFGLIAFSILSLLTIFHIKNPHKLKKQIILMGAILGSIFAIYFIYLQAFVIKASCTYCLIVDIGTILSLVLLLFVREK